MDLKIRFFRHVQIFWAAAYLVLWSFVFSGMAQGASFHVSPTRFEFSLEKRFTESFTISNNSDEPLRIRTYTSFLDVNEENQLVPVKNNPLDLSKYVVLNPRKFVLRPGQKRVVRFSVRRPPANLPPGEYRVVIFFAELPKFSGKTPAKPTSPLRGLGSIRIQLQTSLGITIYGMKGNPRPDAALEKARVSVNASQVTIEGRALNTGNIRVPLTITANLIDQGGHTMGQGQTKITIQQQQWRGFKLQFARPPRGDYRISLRGSDGDAVFFEMELSLKKVDFTQ